MELGVSRTTHLLSPTARTSDSGVYETFLVDTPFLDRHIARMYSGINALGGQWSQDISELTALVSRALVTDCSWATRVRLDATIPPTDDVSLSITGFELTGYDPTLGTVPVSIMTRVADRDASERAWNLKSLSNSDNKTLRADAAAAGHFEGVFVSGEGQVYEGAFSNLFIVRNGGLQTPGTDLVLPGITRQVVLEIADDDALDIDDGGFTVQELVQADEAFITSAIIGIVPLNGIEHEGVVHSIGSDRDRTVTSMFSRLYQSL